MYVIIPASDMEVSLIPLSKPKCKTLVPINGKPVLQYILDELYSYQSHIDEVIIVKRDISDIQDYIKYNKQNDFFLTKIHCVNRETYNAPDASLIDDFYAGMEYLVDKLKVRPSEILLWSADELVFDSKKLTDLTLPSFMCSYKKDTVKIYRFNEFPYVVNTLIDLREDTKEHTMADFLKHYQRATGKLSVLENFGDYRVWDDRTSYYRLQADLLEKSEHTNVKLEIDFIHHTLTKTNKYIDDDFISYSENEKIRDVQYTLWSEANFLEEATPEQSVFLPEYIDRGVNKRGEYCDYVTEEFVSGTTLDSLLMNEDISEDTWRFILERLVTVLREDFHKDALEGEEVWNSFVPAKIRNNFIKEKRELVDYALNELAKYYSEENLKDNYYVMRNNDVAEWKMFFDKFFEMYEKNCTHDNIIYNFTCDRKVHNNLLLSNIVYDTFTNRMTLINPTSRNLDIVDKKRDFVTLFMSGLGLSAIEHSKFVEDCKEMTISSIVQNRMNTFLDVLSDLCEDAEYLRMYAVCEMFLYVYKTRDVNLLKYLSQLRTSLYFRMITT